MEQRQFCRNCGTEVTGEYCSHCGQREGRADRRFLDAAGEALGDVFDLDSRFWKTLFFLLFRPGYLSAEFMAGRRARYLPPLRLYLVISFVIFLVMSYYTATGIVIGGGDGAEGRVSENVVISIDTDEPEAAPGDEAAEDAGEWRADIGLADEDSPEWLKDIDQRAEENMVKLREDPSEFIETMVDYLPQLMFLLLPLFALLVQVAYLFSPFHYLQHLVFALHCHSFAFLLYLIGYCLVLAGFEATGWLYLALVVYLVLALRQAYGSGLRGAIGKSLFIFFSYFWLLVGAFSSAAVVALLLL